MKFILLLHYFTLELLNRLPVMIGGTTHDLFKLFVEIGD